MKRTSRQAVGVTVAAVVVAACALLQVSANFTAEAAAANGTLTPWAYLPHVSRQEPPTPYNVRAQDIVLRLSDMPSGFVLDEDNSGPAEFSDEVLQLGVADAYEVWYENADLLFAGTPIVYNLAAVFYTPEGAHSYIQFVSDNISADPEASPISSPSLGDETIACQVVAQDDPFVAYAITFRNGNLVAVVLTGGFQGVATFDVTITYTQIVEARINARIAQPVAALQRESSQPQWRYGLPPSAQDPTTSRLKSRRIDREVRAQQRYWLKLLGRE